MRRRHKFLPNNGCAMLRIPGSLFVIAIAAILGLSPCSVACEVPEAKPDTLVVCPLPFQQAMVKWCGYREQQGHVIKMVEPPASVEALKRTIRQVAKSGSLKHVLIVGDVRGPRGLNNVAVPTDFVEAKVGVLFGSDPEIATDNPYADLNSDGLPDLSIGRIPLDTVAEIENYIARIIKYESPSQKQQWQRRINFVAGVGGFGSVIDGLIEQTTKTIITDLVPSEYETSMTYGSWCSPFCPDPRRFSEVAISRFNEGCLFWVYIGHGNRTALDRVRMPDRSHLILDNQTVSKLNCIEGSPIALFLACYTGAMDHPVDCLAETMLRQDGGPIAAICGSRVTMPYAMSLLSLEMVHEYFHGKVETLGELTLLSKRRMVKGSANNPKYREMIEGMGKTFSPAPQLLDLERLEHAQLIQLIGDPLLRLKRPESLELQVNPVAVVGDQLQVTGVSPEAGDLMIELAYPRDRFRERPRRRVKYDPSNESLEEYQRTYEKTHDLVWVSKTISIGAGPFAATLSIPADIRGRCIVRGMLQTADRLAIGSVLIEVSKVKLSRQADLLKPELRK
ncbi:C25 family cysteine peptidase [Mariniblastus sp.]|nr:C25 family cysteine peptidase [Mariniblastus sp.]MDA7925810.1 C25 family cysteine peptidase [Mariniblastus sp.]